MTLAGRIVMMSSAILCLYVGAHGEMVGNNIPGTTAYPNGGMRRICAIQGNVASEGRAWCIAVDKPGRFAYVGTGASPGKVIKVRLADFAPTATLTLNTGEDFLLCAVMDPAGEYVYFGTNTKPGRIVKVRLSDFSRVDSIELAAGEDYIAAGAIDAAAGLAYFAASTAPSRIIKVQLSDFTRVAGLTLNTGEDYVSTSVIDPAGGYGYFGCWTEQGIIVRVRLLDFSRDRAVTLNPMQGNLANAAIADGFAIFGTYSYPGRVVKIRLSDFSCAATLALNTGEDALLCSTIDRAGRFIYFGTDTSPARIIKVRLSDFSRIGSLALNSYETAPCCAGISSDGAHAFFGTGAKPWKIVKIGLTNQCAVHASKFIVAEGGAATDVRIYSHAAAGNLRLGIYDNAEPRKLLWESLMTPNSTQAGWVTMPIASGTPGALVLGSGVYWLAWQTDSSDDVPSYTAGVSGDGFYMEQAYGHFPESITSTDITTNSTVWSEYVTYQITPRNSVRNWAFYN